MRLDGDLVRWVEEHTSGMVQRITRTFGGGSRITWLVDVADGTAKVLPLVLRVETGAGAFCGSVLSLEREAVTYRALQGSPARVPLLRAVEPTGRALLLERAPGTSDLRRLPADEVADVLTDFAEVLASLHAVDVDELVLPGFARPSTPEEHAWCDLELWSGLSRRGGDLDPEITYALAWLRAHAPKAVQRTCFVHGDAGPGNFLAHDGRVTAMVDWEFAHIGDPMDDLAWFAFRTCGRSPLTDDLPGLLLRYEKASGLVADGAAMAYYGVFVQLRCAVTTAITVARGGGAVGLPGYLVAHHRFLRGITEATAAATGVEVPSLDRPDAAPTPRTALFDHAIEEIESGVLPDIADPGTALRARSASILVRHLRVADCIGGAIAEAEHEELYTLLGAGRHTDADLRRAAAEAGVTGDADMLAYLARRSQRASWLWEQPSERSERAVP